MDYRISVVFSEKSYPVSIAINPNDDSIDDPFTQSWALDTGRY